MVVVAACGRVGFADVAARDATGDGVISTAHDEDGDGVPDANLVIDIRYVLVIAGT